MKRVLLAALIALNVALLASLLHVNSPTAHAQVARGATDYLAVTARNSDHGSDALYLLNLGKRKIVCWVPDDVTGKLIPQNGGRWADLKRDFGRDKGSEE
jgi:hypothetical protein